MPNKKNQTSFLRPIDQKFLQHVYGGNLCTCYKRMAPKNEISGNTWYYLNKGFYCSNLGNDLPIGKIVGEGRYVVRPEAPLGGITREDELPNQASCCAFCCTDGVSVAYKWCGGRHRTDYC